MVSILMNFTAVLSAVFCIVTALGLLGTLLSLRMAMEGYPSYAIGLTLSAYYGGLVVGTFFCQGLIRRVGHIRAFAAFAAVTTVTVMLHGLYMSALFWGGLRFFTGVAAIGLFMVVESWLNTSAGPENRGRVFSVYMVLSYLGLGLGQLLVAGVDVMSPQPMMIAGIILAVSLVPVAVTGAAQPTLPGKEHYSIPVLFKKSPLAILGCFSAGLITSSIYAMGPVFAGQMGLSTPEAAGFMASAVLGGLALQWPIGMLSDRFDRSVVIIFLGAAVATASIAMIRFGHYRYGMLFPAATVFGGIVFVVYPVAFARAYDLFGSEDIVAVSSALLLSYGIGAATGPFASSLFMTYLDTPHGLFVFCAAVGGAYGAMAYYSLSKKRIERIPVPEQTGFIPMRRTSHVAVHIDPRSGADT
jgi:MFS family permease